MPFWITSFAAGRRIFISLADEAGRLGDECESVIWSTDKVFSTQFSSMEKVWGVTAVTLNIRVFLKINLYRLAVANSSAGVCFRLDLGEIRGSVLYR